MGSCTSPPIATRRSASSTIPERWCADADADEAGEGAHPRGHARAAASALGTVRRRLQRRARTLAATRLERARSSRRRRQQMVGGAQASRAVTDRAFHETLQRIESRAGCRAHLRASLATTLTPASAASRLTALTAPPSQADSRAARLDARSPPFRLHPFNTRRTIMGLVRFATALLRRAAADARGACQPHGIAALPRSSPRCLPAPRIRKASLPMRTATCTSPTSTSAATPPSARSSCSTVTAACCARCRSITAARCCWALGFNPVTHDLLVLRPRQAAGTEGRSANR